MFQHTLNPVFLSLGSLEIRYYGLVYFFGFLLSWIYLKKGQKSKIFTNSDHVEDLIFYVILSSILFSRIFYVLFYNFSNYFSNPLEIFKIWNGGLSIHGGLVGAVLGILYFIKKNKEYKFFQISDILVVPLAFFLIFGRIANFINAELVGRITTIPWAVKFPNVEGFRHPSQLYESAKNILIFLILNFKSNRKHRPGELTALFLILYSTLRFFIEFVREPEIYVGPLTMGQVLCIPTLIIGIYIYKKI